MVNILALSVFAPQIHTPLFVAVRHLPPARGKSFLKGRGLGKKMKFAWTAKGSHFGGAAEQSEAERASPLKEQSFQSGE